MKKFCIVLCSVCLLLLSCTLAACGRDFAKIVGIKAGMVEEPSRDYSYEYGNPLSDSQTLAENDYILQVGEKYFLAVTYVQTGGSRVCSINTETITLKYDAEILDITLPEENGNMEVFYSLTCKKEVAYTAIIVEADGEYSCVVIISAVAR